MPFTMPPYGTPTRVTASGTVAVTSSKAAIMGVLFCTSGTGSVQLFSCRGSASCDDTTALTGVIRFQASATAAWRYQDVPAAALNGIVAVLGNSPDPDLTIFWNPVGG